MRQPIKKANLPMNSETAHNPVITHHKTHQVTPELIDHRRKQRRQSVRPRNDKAKSAHCQRLWNWSNMIECCTYPCNFVITKTMPSLTRAPYRVLCLKVSYAVHSPSALLQEPSALLQEKPAPKNKIHFANSNIVPIRKHVQIRFFLAAKFF